jgi:hypothetical protein
MTNPSVICFVLAFAVMAIGGGVYAYVRRRQIHDWFEGWACYILCKDLHKRGIAIEPATNWVHRRAVEYAIKHNKKAIFMTEG